MVSTEAPGSAGTLGSEVLLVVSVPMPLSMPEVSAPVDGSYPPVLEVSTPVDGSYPPVLEVSTPVDG